MGRLKIFLFEKFYSITMFLLFRQQGELSNFSKIYRKTVGNNR